MRAYNLDFYRSLPCIFWVTLKKKAATLYPSNPTAMQPYSPIALQLNILAALQPCNHRALQSLYTSTLDQFDKRRRETCCIVCACEENNTRLTKNNKIISIHHVNGLSGMYMKYLSINVIGCFIFKKTCIYHR